MNGWLRVLIGGVLVPLIFGSYVFGYIQREAIRAEMEARLIRIEGQLDTLVKALVHAP